jgi:acetyl-CoA carboxylase biotin carboxyl carrier protein
VSLTYDEIAEIIKLIDSSSCDELVVETGDIKLVVRRNGASAGAAAEYVERGSAPVTVSPAAPRKARAAAPKVAAADAADAADATAAGQIEVAAPMVGTFYRAPSPEARAFVDVGDVVGVGDALCLIEVMKLFTTINAEVAGRIVQIGAENGELVEYGRTLFVIEPS